MNDVHRSLAAHGLVRPREGRVLSGTLAGLGARIGLDPWPTRILFLIALALIPGTWVFWAYFVAWILMPSARPGQNTAGSRAQGLETA